MSRPEERNAYDLCGFVHTHCIVTCERLRSEICRLRLPPVVHQHRVVSSAVEAAFAAGTAIKIDSDRAKGGGREMDSLTDWRVRSIGPYGKSPYAASEAWRREEQRETRRKGAKQRVKVKK